MACGTMDKVVERMSERSSGGVITLGATYGLGGMVTDLGGDSSRVLHEPYGVDLLDGDPNKFITLEQYAGLLESAARESGNASFGFCFGHQFDIRKLGSVGYAMELSRTLGDALEILCKHFDCIQENSEIRLYVLDGLCYLEYIVLDYRNYQRAQDAETTIGLIHGFCEKVVGEIWQCSNVFFKHGRVSNDKQKRKILGIDPEFSQSNNALVFPKEMLDFPLSSHDPWLLSLVKDEVLKTKIQTKYCQPFINDVYNSIWERLEKSQEVHLNSVAADFSISERTLQLRLSDAGTKFRTLRSEVTLDRAANLLVHSYEPATSIALNLGFSESSAFSRAFKIRFGMTPSEYRTKFRRTD